MSVDRAVILLLLLKMQLNCTTVEKYSALSRSQVEVSVYPVSKDVFYKGQLLT